MRIIRWYFYGLVAFLALAIDAFTVQELPSVSSFLDHPAILIGLIHLLALGALLLLDRGSTNNQKAKKSAIFIGVSLIPFVLVLALDVFVLIAFRNVDFSWIQ